MSKKIIRAFVMMRHYISSNLVEQKYINNLVLEDHTKIKALEMSFQKLEEKRKINEIYLKKDIEEIEFEIETGNIKSEKQIKILNFIKNNEGATIPEIEMFTDSSRAIVNT